MSWTDNFFGKYYLKTHQPALYEERTIQEVRFIKETLGLPENAYILDLPCGHGRHSILLAKLGYNVIGIDNQSEFISMAKENSKNLDNIKFILNDMRKIEYENEFDALICMFTSFGYFSDEENLLTLEKMSKSLKSKGKLLIETINREWSIHKQGCDGYSQAWMLYPPDNIVFIANDSFDLITSSLISKQAVIDKEERYLQEQNIRLYTYTEMENMLKKFNMKIIQCYGDFYKDEYNADSGSMIIIAEKN